MTLYYRDVKLIKTSRNSYHTPHYTYVSLKYMLSVTVKVIQDSNMSTGIHDHLPCVVCQIQYSYGSIEAK